MNACFDCERTVTGNGGLRNGYRLSRTLMQRRGSITRGGKKQYAKRSGTLRRARCNKMPDMSCVEFFGNTIQRERQLLYQRNVASLNEGGTGRCTRNFTRAVGSYSKCCGAGGRVCRHDEITRSNVRDLQIEKRQKPVHYVAHRFHSTYTKMSFPEKCKEFWFMQRNYRKE